MIGETFDSRVAASLLMNVGMGELVAHNEREYVGVTDALLRQPEKLDLLRLQLDTGRNKFMVYDAVNYALRFERAMLRMLSESREFLR